MTQPISKEMLKSALIELAQTDREFFLTLWKDVFKPAIPTASKPQHPQKTKDKASFTLQKTNGVRLAKTRREGIGRMLQFVQNNALPKVAKIEIPSREERNER